MNQVVVRQLADADIERATAWYAREDQRLAARFATEISRTVDRIGALPDSFPEIGDGVRRALLHQFPYAAYFIRREKVAIVIAVLHQHRRPVNWKTRADVEVGPAPRR